MSKVEVVSRIAALRFHRPVRDEQRAGAGIEERAGESRQRFRAGLVAGDGVAGGEHHPVRVELELRHLAGGEQAVVGLARLLRQVSASDGSANPLTSPATSPCVAK